jgi:hypothetical protein
MKRKIGRGEANSPRLRAATANGICALANPVTPSFCSMRGQSRIAGRAVGA